MISKTWKKLTDPEYRKAFVSSQINIRIPFQIRALMKERGWKQEDLAKAAGMLQPRISGLLSPGKTRPNIETLRRLAEAFDCGLIVRFAPFSELVRWSEEFDPESFSAPSFVTEQRMAEQTVGLKDATDPGVVEIRWPHPPLRHYTGASTGEGNRLLRILPKSAGLRPQMEQTRNG
jgi:transcriptional regulator with XRE-family HTH domain